MNAAVAPQSNLPLNEQNLTQAELEQARLFLEQTQNAVIGATKGLSPAQWAFKPSADRWSVAENLDHIVIVLERVLGPIAEQLANAPEPPSGVDREAVDAIVIHRFPTRLAKFQAPEFLHPADRITPAELLDRLEANYRLLHARLETPGLRRHAIEALPLKAVSGGAFFSPPRRIRNVTPSRCWR